MVMTSPAYQPPETLVRAARLLQTAESVIVVGHMHSDGDSLGSTGALAHLLQDAGKQALALLLEPLPDKYRLLGELADFTSELPRQPVDLVVCLDTDNVVRLGAARPVLELGRKTLGLDHHSSHRRFCQLCYVDPNAAAVGEIIFELAHLAGFEICPTTATLLLAALMTDTGNFCYSNTTPKSLETAARLIEKGAKHGELVENLYYCRSLPSVKLAGRALARAQRHPEADLVWSWLERSDFFETGATQQDTEGIIDELRRVPAEVTLLLVEEAAGRTRLSLRSRGQIDVAAMCKLWGGGGHSCAAGATIEVTREEALRLVLDQLSLAVKEEPRVQG